MEHADEPDASAQREVLQKIRYLQRRCLTFESELANSANALARERQKLAEACADADQLRLELELEKQRHLSAERAGRCMTCSIEADAIYESEKERVLNIGDVRASATDAAVATTTVPVVCSQEDMGKQVELLRVATHQCQQLQERNRILEENQQACSFCRNRFARAEKERFADAKIEPAEHPAMDMHARTSDTPEIASPASKGRSSAPARDRGQSQDDVSAVANALSRVARPASAKSPPNRTNNLPDCAPLPYTNLELAKFADFTQDSLELAAPRPSSELGHHKSSADFKTDRPNSNCSTRASTRLSERMSPSMRGSARLSGRISLPKALSPFSDQPSDKSDAMEHLSETLKGDRTAEKTDVLPQGSDSMSPPFPHQQKEKSQAAEVLRPLPSVQRPELAKAEERGSGQHERQSKEEKAQVLNAVEKVAETKAQKLPSVASSPLSRLQDSAHRPPALVEAPASEPQRAPEAPSSEKPREIRKPPPVVVPSKKIVEEMPVLPQASAAESSESSDDDDDEVQDVEPEPVSLAQIRRRSSLGQVLEAQKQRRLSEDLQNGNKPQHRRNSLPGTRRGSFSERRASLSLRRDSHVSEVSVPDEPMSPKTPNPKKTSMRPVAGELALAETAISGQQLSAMLQERHKERIANIEDPDAVWDRIETELVSRRVLLASSPPLNASGLVRDFWNNLVDKRIHQDRDVFRRGFKPQPPRERPPDVNIAPRRLPLKVQPVVKSKTDHTDSRGDFESPRMGKLVDDFCERESSFMAETTGGPSEMLSLLPVQLSEMETTAVASEPYTPTQMKYRSHEFHAPECHDFPEYHNTLEHCHSYEHGYQEHKQQHHQHGEGHGHHGRKGATAEHTADCRVSVGAPSVQPRISLTIPTWG